MKARHYGETCASQQQFTGDQSGWGGRKENGPHPHSIKEQAVFYNKFWLDPDDEDEDEDIPDEDDESDEDE